MRSFASFASVAALAFASFTSAAPIIKADVSTIVAADVPGVTAVGVGADVAAVVSVPKVLRRQGEVEFESIPEILASVIDNVTPIVEELGALTEVDATIDIITPLAVAIVDILNEAIGKVNNLVGQPIETILGTVEGTLDIASVAQLLGSLLTLVFTTLNTVLRITGAVAGGDLFIILLNVGVVLGQLVQVVLAIVASVVGGLLEALLPLVGSILPIVTGLGLNTLGGLLGGVLGGNGGLIGGVLGGAL
ncbi:hypothetical protein BDV98DRAFT_574445 [Pterulicium gracile]|uniref:Sc15 protein n=1 Tax=Pterulicium gracile TaxID=1884261 RepID=A0A5C3Q8C5_9AGAR|nr:hypothetical protein BDV98DRAFT_574445 [Pterula gracilis]